MLNESVTRVLARMLDLLALDNPRGTAIGALGGSFAIFLVQLCLPLLERQRVIDPLHTPWILYIGAGIFAANVARSLRRDVLPQHLETQIKLIALGVKTRRIPPEVAGRMYRELVEYALAHIDAEQANQH